MGKFIAKALIIAIIAYLLVMVALFFLQRQFMYVPPKTNPGLASTSLTSMSEVEINGVNAWWHPSEEGEAVVIFFHGNGSSVYDGRFIYQHFIEQGFGVLGAEYPGYPGSSGSATQNAIVDAALAQYDFVAAHLPSEQIYLYGTSLGAGIAAQVASRREVGKLVMEAPFNSMMDMVRLRMRFFAFPPMIKDKYESDKALTGLAVPILWLHGTHDRVIPLEQGRKLYDGYAGSKNSLVIEGGSHNDLWISGGREAITAFLKS